MLRLPPTPSAAAIKAIGLSVRPPRSQVLAQRRRFAASAITPPPSKGTKVSIKNPIPPVSSGGAGKDAPRSAPPKKAESPVSPTPATPFASKPTTATQVPLVPPSPPKVQTSPPSGGSTLPPKSSTQSAPPPPAPAPKPPKKKHRIRNFLIGLTLFTGLSFGTGVFYSLKSDNVHDFFTEYIPFGEEAVLYLEEREFRRRFPNALSRIQHKVDSPKVTIPKSSGATWKIADRQTTRQSADVGKQDGPHISSRPPEPEAAPAPTQPAPVTKPNPALSTPQKDRAVKEAVPRAAGAVAALSSVEIDHASDPVVEDLVNVVNNIIRHVNDTNASETFRSTIANAKTELSNLNEQIGALKAGMEKTVKEKLDEKDLEFAKAAQGLLKNVNNQVEDMEHQLREEFQNERDRITVSYQRKLQTELERTKEVMEQRLRNELLEQAIEMKRKWVNGIEDRVEHERGGRLGKLKELENAVEELEKLTAQWSEVINTNLKTQQTFTALEAIKAACESPEQPKPFLREMAALKEVAEDDEVIRTAIASINPAAYQNGVSTHVQLVDRFRKVAAEVRRAALLPEDAGVAAHAGNWVLSKFMFKKSGLAQGNDVESILANAETYLEEGDVDSAAREMNQLSGWARTLAKDWLRDARLLLEVQQAVDVIAAEVRLQSLRVQ